MRPKPLQTLLQSVSKQTVYPNEILIVDGSRNDETKVMLQENPFENLHYFKVDDSERGLTKQRNFGIRNVSETSEIVCFLDDDTILDENYFKNLLETYTIHPNALGVGGFITNEVQWTKITEATKPKKSSFVYDGWFRKESLRFRLRRKFGLLDDTKPCYLPTFAHGRSVSFLPPTDKIYEVELFMGGVSSFRKGVFDTIKFSMYFEGYGLYEDADFTLRVSKIGQLYVNTAAKLEHHHNAAGRPNQYHYGKMVVKNGWHVWRVKYPTPTLKARIKWNATTLFLAVLRFTNIFTAPKKMEAFTESLGRFVAWFSLWFQKRPNRTMSFLRKIYNIFLSERLKETLKELYFNQIRKEKFKRLEGNYHTTFANGIEIVTKLPMYYVVNDIARYETFYSVQKDDIVIDAGANHGHLATFYSKKVGTKGKVYAFEPDKKNITEMKANMALNSDMRNIQIQEELIWDKNTQLDFFEAGTVSSSIHYKPKNAKTILKDAITIDSFYKKEQLQRLDFIKMDIEGAEIEAMDGLVEVLEKFKPNFAIASYHWVNDEQTYKKIEAFFKAKNYPHKTIFYKDGEVITFAGNNIA